MNKKLKTYLQYVQSQPSGFAYKEKKANTKELLEKLKKTCIKCTKCPLSKLGRTQVVFGKGNQNTKLMLIGEGPGKNEDLQGEPFVGRSGQLLTKILEAVKLKREDVYISNVVKCRPPENRTPSPEESKICKNSFLFKEIEIISPQIICTLGACATQAILGKDTRISQARGNFHAFQQCLVMPTYHPAYLLRNPVEKRTVWEDMTKIIKKLKEIEKEIQEN